MSSDDALKWSGQQLPKRRVLGIKADSFHFNDVIYSHSLNAFIAIGSHFTAYYSFSGNTEKSRINNEWLNLMPANSQFRWLFDSKELTGISDCDIN